MRNDIMITNKNCVLFTSSGIKVTPKKSESVS